MSAKNSIKNYLIEENRWQGLVQGCLLTLSINVLGIILSLIFAITFFLINYTGHKVLTKIFTKIFFCIKYIPGSTWLLLVFYIIFAGNSVSNYIAILFAIMVLLGQANYGIICGAIFSIDQGQQDAAFSMGYTRMQALTKIFLPQALPAIFEGLAFAYIDMVKFTALAGMISVADFQAISDGIRAQTAEPFIPIIMCALFYALLAMTVNQTFLWLSRKAAASSEEIVKDRLMKGKM